jgi:glycosyltransferase involved in cell wall biosynthesis
MKILFDHPDPFLLAHGGVLCQIEATKRALEQLDVQVEFLRWWDDRQKGDLIHFFGRAPASYLAQAKKIGLPVVMTSFLSAAANRSKQKLWLQAMVTRTLAKAGCSTNLGALLGWSRYHQCSLNVVGLRAEQFVLEYVHRVPAERISTVPLGVSSAFFKVTRSQTPENHLITVGTIRDIKRSIELAEMAREVEARILFVGKPYVHAGAYWKRFQGLIDNRWVIYRPHVESEEGMADLLRHARGFVVMSHYENWCLAAHEAAAIGLPLLLPDLPWSRERFGNAAHYFSKGSSAAALRQFYNSSPSLPSPKVQVPTWDETARRLMQVYQRVIENQHSDPQVAMRRYSLRNQ